jgi:hypothetical protein
MWVLLFTFTQERIFLETSRTGSYSSMGRSEGIEPPHGVRLAVISVHVGIRRTGEERLTLSME